ncbi:DUF4190 domain-containing protein [Streptomyces sp. NPDC003703]|uniref:DUF4190 domain-containing protein n=1 Tax=Streptomyces sp. NPDC003283 TaxID=3364681 RepID=UPI0036759EE3
MDTYATRTPHHPAGPGPGARTGTGGRGGNGLTVTAMVLGVAALTTSVVVIGGPLGVVGLVLGAVALRTADRTGTGRGMAVTGLVTSAVAVVVSVLVAVLVLWYADHTQKCYRPDSFHQYTQCVRDQLGGH